MRELLYIPNVTDITEVKDFLDFNGMPVVPISSHLFAYLVTRAEPFFDRKILLIVEETVDEETGTLHKHLTFTEVEN